jgi:hypothetical protein
LGVIFVSLGIAKIHQEPIPKELSDVSIKALDDLGTDAMIGTHHIPVLFRIELGGEFRGINQVTEHDGKLAPFGFGRMWYGW